MAKFCCLQRNQSYGSFFPRTVRSLLTQCLLLLSLYGKLCVSCFTNIPVCASPHNILNSSNTRTYLASQRLPSSLLVLILTLVTIPSTISESIFTELKDQNLCRDDSGNDDWENVFSEDVRNDTACKDLCEEHNSKCVAITYWTARKRWDEGGGWYGCSLHSRLCHDPRGKHRNGRDVFRRTCDVTFWESKDDSSVSVGVVTIVDTYQYLTVAHVNLHLGYFDVGKIGNIYRKNGSPRCLACVALCTMLCWSHAVLCGLMSHAFKHTQAGNGIYELWRSNEEYPGYADTFEQLCQANCILLKDMNSSKWKQDYTYVSRTVIAVSVDMYSYHLPCNLWYLIIYFFYIIYEQYSLHQTTRSEMRQKLKNGQDLSSIVKYKVGRLVSWVVAWLLVG